MRVRCWLVRRALDSLAAGEARGRRAESLRRHLRLCDACAEEFRKAAGALDALRSAGEDVTWGEAAAGQSWRAIRARLSAVPQRRVSLRPLPVAAAAVGTLLIAAGAWMAIVPGGELERGTPDDMADVFPADYSAVSREQVRVPVMQEYSLDALPVSYEVEWGRF